VILCPAHTAFTQVTLLKRPAGGTIIGGSVKPEPPIGSPGERAEVPRVVGFSPRDASHALALVELRPRPQRRSEVSGLRRVLAQSPAANLIVRSPKGTSRAAEEVALSGVRSLRPSCAGVASFIPVRKT
jgi:hypothetical protein